MNNPSRTTLILAGLAVGSGLEACSPLSPQEDPTRFYYLRRVEASQETERVKLDVSIGVGPIRLTPYLKRTPIATRVGKNEIEYSQIDRWAEPLANVIPFIIAQNLNRLLDPDDIELHPWYGADRMQYAVKVDMLAFNRNTAGDAELEADWEIEDNTGRDLYSDYTKLVVPATDNTTEASVFALGVALSDFSLEIAAAIRDLEATRQADSR